jgi:hypothetical protein
MARPPSASARVPEVSRTSSSESHRRQPRRSSVDSYTSQASTIPIDIVQLPNGDRDRRGDLGVIHEVPSPATNSVAGSATTAAPAPTWFTNPPVDYGRRQTDGGMNRATVSHRRLPTHISRPIYLTRSLARFTLATGTNQQPQPQQWSLPSIQPTAWKST